MTSFNPHEYLNTFTNFEANLHHINANKFNLDRIIELLDALDNPQLGLRIIHVAGTKGKGSTCAMIASIVQQAGFKVGLYTSPHFYQVNERIRILDKTNIQSTKEFAGSMSDEHMAYLLERMKPAIDEIITKHGFLTYFEVLTVLAIVYFAQMAVDIVVLETGLGGRLDATNVVDSHIAVITPISLDHMNILGSTIEAIAQEKAGIIKDQYQLVVVAPQIESVNKIIDQQCATFDIKPRHVKVDTTKRIQHIALEGKHQLLNASVAIDVIECLRSQGLDISDEAIDKGLSTVQWPGRFEKLQDNPTVIVDGAHNQASARVLIEAIKDLYPHRQVCCVVGVSSDKDVQTIMHELKQGAQEFVLSQSDHARAYQFTEEEARYLLNDRPYQIINDLSIAIKTAIEAAKSDDIVLITGSLFTVAQAKEILRNT